MRIVIVDADSMSGRLLQFVLGEAGHKDIVHARGVSEALEEVIGRETDAVILDMDLPDMTGVELCRELRARRYSGPIMFVSYAGTTQDKVSAFSNGADDFVVKPFDPEELVARLDAVVRRYKQADYQSLGTVLKAGDAELSIGQLTFCVEGRPPVRLTPTEMQILECLMRNVNITIRRDTLIERAWGCDFLIDTNRVDVYIRRLREKIERDPSRPEYIHTVRGVGYVFRPPRPSLTPLPWEEPVVVGSEIAD